MEERYKALLDNIEIERKERKEEQLKWAEQEALLQQSLTKQTSDETALQRELDKVNTQWRSERATWTAREEALNTEKEALQKTTASLQDRLTMYIFVSHHFHRERDTRS